MKKGNKTYRINGEDEPTSVFILKNTKNRTLKQRFHKIKYNRKKKRIEKIITGESRYEYGICKGGGRDLDQIVTIVQDTIRTIYQKYYMKEVVDFSANFITKKI